MTIDKMKVEFNSITIQKSRKLKKIHASRMHELILTYSGEEFERFIFEWLKFCKNKINESSDVYKIGGTGDKGIDIFYKNKDEVVYYQAKQYNRQLNINDVVDICVKILWYASKEEIPEPSKIYIVSSKGIQSKLLKTFNNKAELKVKIITNLVDSLNRIKIDYVDEELKMVKSFIESQDFSMVDTIDADVIALEYYKSDIGPVRFIKEQPFKFRKTIKRESYSEDKFVAQIKSIYPQGKIQTKVLSDAKNDYYSCLCLKETDKYLFGDNCEFNSAKEEVYQGVNMLFYNKTDSNDRYVECLKQATQLSISDSALGDNSLGIVNNSDRKGFCHYLVNEERISWVTDDEEN